jgi:FK506-binding nuclear protein
MALARKLQQQRDVARAAQDWTKADALRDQIQKLGVKVQDSKVGDGGGSKIVLTKQAVLEGKVAKKERQAVAAGKPLKAAKPADDEEGNINDEDGDDDDDDESGSEEEDYLSDEEEEEEEEVEEKVVRAPPAGAERTLAMGVRVADLEVGRGPPVQPRAAVRVHYVGKLASTGAVFDATKGKPFCFRLGRGEVIKGWDLGVAGMRKGGTRRITCPPGAGYGAQGTPGIPPNSTLVFEVTVV